MKIIEKSIMKKYLISFLLIVLSQHFVHGSSMQAHLSADWYPTEKEKLTATLHALQKKAHDLYPATLQNVRAIIIPHAGYAYSGAIAASCFNLLHHASNQFIDRVIVLTPAHAISFKGFVVPDHVQEYIIPTGTITFDTKVMKELIAMSPLFIALQTMKNNPFNQEHSFEIQCPFIHTYINEKIPVIPLLVGYLDEQDAKNAATIIKKIMTPHTLIIVSSDFTHYGPQFDYMPFGPTPQAAQAIHALDNKVMEQIIHQSLHGFLQTIKTTGATVCGQYPIAVLLALLENKSLGPIEPHLVAYTTSSKVENNKNAQSSVSYAGIAFANDASPTFFEKQSLLNYAKDIVATHLATNPEKNDSFLRPLVMPWMKKICGTFVTWYKPDHNLRGCIGTVQSENSLIDNVRIYAQQAAFHDPRFAPISQQELPQLTPSITMLTPFQEIKSYKDIKVGVHGIILKHGSNQAVFLPQVSVEFGWNLVTTLQQLSLKAGLDKDAWKDKMTIFEVCQGYEIS